MSHSAHSARERILQVASDLFYREGVRAVGIDRVIAESGVAKATLYKHFPSKDDLVVACLERRDGPSRRWLETETLRRGTTPQEQLLGFFDVLEEWFSRKTFRGCAFMNTSLELADSVHPVHAITIAHKDAIRAFLYNLCLQLDVRDAKGLASQFMLLYDGAIVTAVMHRDACAAIDARTAAETLLAAAQAMHKKNIEREVRDE
jgi:AcrR family transcriptional regulator